MKLQILCIVILNTLSSTVDSQRTQYYSWKPWNDHHNRRRTRRMGVNLTGPNVCHEKGSTYCCPGWTTSGNGKMCTRAKCDEGRCGSGLCQKPNVCLCMDGRQAPSCPSERQERKCNVRCMHGGECVDNQCRCAYGYTGPHCGQPICGPGCLNGGRCITPGRCACVYGFTGMRCERDYRKGPCFLTRTNTTCSNQVRGVMCTKLFCCATVGEGWGHPCEECPARVGNCTKGRLPPLCTDINECDIMRGLCEGGECVNTDGSFTCRCPEGFSYDRTTHKCVDINECLGDVCAGGTCVNTEGGFVCECPENFKLSQDRTYCIADFPGRCYTQIESGMCASPLSNLIRRTMCCCVQSGLETLGKCFAAVGQYPVRCAAIGTPEYQQDCGGTAPIAGICDIMGDQACAHGTCVDLQEQQSYYCECDDGYQNLDDKKICVDIDECRSLNGQINDICGRHGTCMNTEGSYVCHCNSGFANQPGGMTSCVDVDECAQDGMCTDGTCINTKGSFVCNCNVGFRVSATNQECQDINECSETQGLCNNGRCINLRGSYRCICHPGFFASEDSTQCLDENECERDNMCANGDCVNMEGRYKCVCHGGFLLRPDGQGCVDINECDNNPCVNGRCENTLGSFICICHRFQRLDDSGTRCILRDETSSCYRSVRNGECRARNALLQPTTRSECCCAVPGSNSAWGDSCEPCPEQIDSDYAVLCTGVRLPNICDLLENPCENGVCIKMGNNQYRCSCNRGFLVSDDQRSCIDFDECTKNLCSNGICRNTPGSYSCTCNDGYVLSGDVCEDVDECLSNPCTRANCINLPGSYRCVCEEGFVLGISGHVCYDVKTARCWLRYSDAGECSGNVGGGLMTAAQCCNSVGVAWGNVNCQPCSAFEFACERGFVLDPATEQCVNINECELNICQEPASCVDTIGSFRCVCPPHLVLNAVDNSCGDVRVGNCFLGDDENACGVQIDALMMTKQDCCCTTGRGWGTDSCEPCPASRTEEQNSLCAQGVWGRVNECVLFPAICGNGACKNTDSSFMCECNDGFTVDDTGRNCSDIDECFISPGVCGNGKCDNTFGDFRCICDEGFEEAKMMKVCIDINECNLPGYCTGGNCINTEGSYQCVCPDGRSLSDDMSKCIDIDECALRPDLCSPNGRCENMLGYYMCICDIGYVATPNARDCVDVDECRTNNGGCHHSCTNTIGSYECSCDDGFALAFDGHTCADRDECMEHMNRCDGGRCENTEGAFRCVCFDGFMSTNDLQFCEDIDECAMNPNICMHGKCHNTRGSYTCNCDDGYCVPQGQMICVDEDECEMSKHNCHVNADCNNTEGGYECHCIAGFHGDGFMCHDDNECEMGTHMCHEFATCINKLGTYECECTDGYHGDGFSCSDNDDCLEDETLCGPHGQCINIQGSFECDCPAGFDTTYDSKACKDIDECAFEQICVNGRCHNVPGGFSCDCLDGYEKDEQGANCTDVDECERVANCINGICVNTDGTYECQCPEGFQQNPSGVGCVDTRSGDCFLKTEGDDLAPVCTGPIGVGVSKAECCCTEVGGWGNPCEVCPDVNSTEYDTLCPGGNGYRLNPINVMLTDIDECVTLPGLCKGGTCMNLFGSYICQCPMGYERNVESRACEDVDECFNDDESITDVCGAGECQNTVGGYNCLCPEGYKSVMGGRKCEDIRIESCHRYYNVTSEECSSELPFEDTKINCCCHENIGQGWNTPCEACPTPGTEDFIALCGVPGYLGPENICQKFPKLCENGICIQAGKTHRCECKQGYHYNADLIVCEDDDECVDDDICFSDSECQNLPGSYTCACASGFIFDEITSQCVDVDECAEEGACANGFCENSRGSFECDCNQGFQQVNDGQACEDVNECTRDPCGPGTCLNVYGSFSCACDTGFRISDNGDCVDRNECDEEGQCHNGVCENTPGGFACICNDGYSVTPDGRVCIDENECNEDATICSAGTCQNMDGSYKCYCPDGYTSDSGKSCDDIDECEEPGMCLLGTCENVAGSFVCNCPAGFLLSGNGKICIDMREATCYKSISGGVCSDVGHTSMTKSTCCCQCFEGSAWGDDDGCEACPAQNSTAFNELCPGGCGVTPTTLDLNECDIKPCVNGQCLNTPGSFKCYCQIGFELDDSQLRCVDVDECLSDSTCGHGTCQNTVGGFECDCDDGYYNGPGITCLDVDECAHVQLNHCGFRCVNLDGGFECACPNGYKLRPDERMCEDIDECAEDSLNDCMSNGMACRNLIGRYMCLCPPGYRRLGVANTCVDVNECEQSRVCTNGICVNAEGTYACQCFDGYDYDEENKLCLDTRQGLCYASIHQRMCEVTSTTGLPFTKAECCCNRGKGWGEDCEECPHPGTGAFMLLCPHGIGFGPNGEDVDDCKVLPGLCAYGTCINTLGSFRCACNHGYEPSRSKQRCLDVNECVETPSPCSFDCRNTNGGFECVCPQGYQIDRDNSACVDLDECATKQHNCQYLCINTVGSFKCECPHGFVQEGSQCVDKNECVDMPGVCGGRGVCRNDPGGYHCECPRGYRRDDMQGVCIDIDECGGMRGGSSCAGNCQNTAGSFRCLCGRGFRSTLYGRGCQDIDECARSPCGAGQSCSNKQGSFSCGCGSGLMMTPGGCGDVNECQLGRGSCSFGCSNNYGGFSCSCPPGAFRAGAGNCIRGQFGFQQQIPRFPSEPYGGGYGPPPQYGAAGFGAPRDRVCYSCMPGGDVGRRMRRSAGDEDDESARFIEVSDRTGKAHINTSFPIEIYANASDLTHHVALLELRPAFKQLRNNMRYAIAEGNGDRLFRLHRRERYSVLHVAKAGAPPGVYQMKLRGASTLSEKRIKQAAFDSPVIEQAIRELLDLDVKIHIE